MLSQIVFPMARDGFAEGRGSMVMPGLSVGILTQRCGGHRSARTAGIDPERSSVAAAQPAEIGRERTVRLGRMTCRSSPSFPRDLVVVLTDCGRDRPDQVVGLRCRRGLARNVNLAQIGERSGGFRGMSAKSKYQSCDRWLDLFGMKRRRSYNPCPMDITLAPRRI